MDRRNKYFYLSEWMDYAIRWYGIDPGFVDLTGLEKYNIRSQADLAKALIAEKKRAFAERSIQYKNSKGIPVTLTLAEIEERLYDLSFDPNHPPELRWGAAFGSDEMSGAPSRPTPVPGGARVPMEEAYRLETYYRHVGLRETEMSLLRGMFTEGFPVRDKYDTSLTKWFGFYQPSEALKVAQQQAAPALEMPALVPAHFTPVQVRNALTPVPREASAPQARRAPTPREERVQRRSSHRHTPLLQNPPRIR
ncbi:MAG: hypothetical protein IT368_14385 [Candidatus Hydrogenedentes bacterium]|nr:hypothetical protein [Candidatus Hydrogenedentota bacterium]